MSQINATFAGEIRAQLARKQLTTAQLAQELNISKSTAYRLLNGEQSWSFDQATRAGIWAGLDFSLLIPVKGESA
jgi:transcriptional regulator with XRE-family HTH domain